MEAKILKETGYQEAAYGFSLSYNTNIERVCEILPRYAFGIPGENKFLEQIIIYLDVNAPRFWWQEADTYRVGCSKQSQSTMHTICKKPLTQENFEYPIPDFYIEDLNTQITMYKTISTDWKREFFVKNIKNRIPEGFLQRRVWLMSYKTFQNIYIQRATHRLPQWQYFINTILSNIEHPEFIRKES